MSYASAVEPLRGANHLSERALYRWCHVTIDGEPIEASNGIRIAPDAKVGDAVALDALFVCAGGNPALFRDRKTFAWLRRLARDGVPLIAGMSGGPFVLARAGLLAGRRCTLHWEHIPAFVEDFPDLKVRRTLYEIDGDRVTCAGGIAALDMMLALIARDHGAALALAVSEWFLRTQERPASDAQRLSPGERFGTHDGRLIAVLQAMEQAIEEPLAREMLAAQAGLSVRQLERLFAERLGTTLRDHYLGVRLDHAAALVRQTAMSVAEIAVACGFVSASHFSRAYKTRHGRAPALDRDGRV